MNKKTTVLTLNAVALALASMSFAVNAGEKMVNPEGGVVVGYWHNWADGRGYKAGNAPAMSLEATNPMYNVVAVSFMKVYNVAEGRIPTFHLDPATGMTEQQFIDQIKLLNDQGRAVLLALGGADAHVEMKTGDEQEFADEIIRLTDIYGFDGLDIDLEQGAIDASNNQTVIPAALRIVKDHYREQGKNFLITMAPEFPYLKDKYIPYIQNLEGYYDWINPQFYNQGGDGIWVDGLGWLSQDKDEQKEDFIYHIADALINGKSGFVKIPHDKLVFGIPTNIDAAATGYIQDPQDLFDAFKRLENQAQPLRGVMTWSINWDVGTNASGVAYNSSFINTYGPYVHGQMPPPVVQPGKPSITGIADVRVQHKSTFNEMSGVTANDKEDGNLTDSISVTGNVDTQRVGEYVLTYSVTDSDNNETVSPRKVTVFSALPTFAGVANSVIKIGENFDPMTGVSATDAEDGDLTAKISVSGTVNTAIAGQYELVYSITDSANQTVTAKRIVVVNDGSIVCTPAWQADATYVEGNVVSHNGKEWQAGWWTEGNEPGTTGEWGVWREVGNTDCGGGTEQPDIDFTATLTGVNSNYTITNGTAKLTLNYSANKSSSVQIDVIDTMGYSVSGGQFTDNVDSSTTINMVLNDVVAGKYSLRMIAESNNENVEQRLHFTLEDKGTVEPPVTDAPAYEAGKAYLAGDKVLANDGNIYQCKPWPYTGWCANASYAPGTSQYWADAWDKL